MSLVTIIDARESILICSDGQTTDDSTNPPTIDGGFKKFIVTPQFVFSVTGTKHVADVLFEEFQKQECGGLSIRDYLNKDYTSYNPHFIMILAAKGEDSFIYNIYIHNDAGYTHQEFTFDDGGILVSESGHISHDLKQRYNDEIKQLLAAHASTEVLQDKQAEFHREVSKVDPTVNDELFMHVVS